MMVEQTPTTQQNTQTLPNMPRVIYNLLQDTGTPVLVYIAERHGLPRVPGLDKQALITRLLSNLSTEELADLADDLIAAHYGGFPVQTLLDKVLLLDAKHSGRSGNPHLEDMPAENARLTESDTQYWVYTMHGHDVKIDLRQRTLACDCAYFRFSSHRQALCKHIARALTLIPEAYARAVLIELLVAREYGGPDTPHWHFKSLEELDLEAA